MSLKKTYSLIANNAECLRQQLYLQNPLRHYFRYLGYIATAQGPKLSYVNQFEPEYTSNTVRYNAHIVAGMFFTTLIVAEMVRRNKQKK